MARPALQNNRGHPLLLFKRILIGHAQTIPVVLKNEGELVCKAYLDVGDQSGVFKVEAGDDVTLVSMSESEAETNEDKHETNGSRKSLHDFVFELQYQESATFWVTFVPKEEKRYHDGIRVVVEKNNFEELGL